MFGSLYGESGPVNLEVCTSLHVTLTPWRRDDGFEFLIVHSVLTCLYEEVLTMVNLAQNICS